MAVIRTKGNTFNFAQGVLPGARGLVGDASNKVDKDPTTHLALMEQLPASIDALGSTLAERDTDGTLRVAATSSPGYAAETQWVQDKIDALTLNPSVLAKVVALEYAPTTPLALNTDGSTYTTIPTISVLDANSGEVYDCFPVVHYTGAGGIKIRRKSNGVAATNLLGVPSFESGAAVGYTSSGGITFAVDNADSRSGTYSLKATVTATASGQRIFSPWCPHEQGIKASVAAYIKRITSTSRTVRVDGQYGDASGNVLATFNGSNATPGTDWTTRAIGDSAHLGTGSQTAPAGTTQVRLQFTIVSPVAGDIFRLDDAQVERADTIPAYGSTGGSGGALATYGLWYPDVPVAQAAGVAPTGVSFATTGAKALAGFHKITVGGTGLTGQHIEYEAAVATPGQATSITWAALSAARVVVPA